MHPAVAKCQSVARIAKAHGWHGSFSSVTEGEQTENACRVTTLEADRAEESVTLVYADNTLITADYSILGKVRHLDSRKELIGRLQGQPKIMEIFELFPTDNRPNLVRKYRQMPFDEENASDSDIITALQGRTLWWYNRMDGATYHDVVKPSNKNRIQAIGHRRMLHFVGRATGFRSTFIDQVLQLD